FAAGIKTWVRATGPSLVSSALPCLPGEVAERESLADELDTEQRAEQPDRRYRNARPEIKREHDAEQAAAEHPAPVRKRPDGEREDHLRDALHHEEYDQQECQREQALAGIAQEQQADDDEERDRDELQPEVRNIARPDQAQSLEEPGEDQDPAEEHHG